MGALATVDVDKRDTIVSRNPATGEILGEVREQSAAEIRDAVARARAAQAAWGALPVEARADKVGAFRDAIVQRAEELCGLVSAETGKTRVEALSMEVMVVADLATYFETGKTRVEALSMEVMVVADLATYFVKRAARILQPEPISIHLLKNRASYLHYVPRGVVGIISPWNFPFGIATGEIIMALLAGNAVVQKPSEVTPLIALKTKELYDAAGLPPDLFQVTPGRGAAGAALIDAGIDYCVFTGSTATGKKVAAACGERLIPCTLELGGKAPAIVCADADVERTARALVWGAFANQGQVCVSVERVYAHQAIHDELVHHIVEQVNALKPGHDTGSMTWERQTEIVEEHLKEAVAAGAKVRTGGQRRGAGLAFAPTVLTDCKQDMGVMRREIFGPLMPIMKVDDEEQAVALANDSQLGLMAYVFTGDKQKGKRLAERLEAGTTMVNDCLLTFGIPETPWGGVKQSGIGVTHSDKGLRDLCQARHVNYDRLALKKELWWYPYSEKLYRQTIKMMRWIFR